MKKIDLLILQYVYYYYFTINIGSMKAHQDDVTGIFLLPDETSIVTVSKDKSMKVKVFYNNLVLAPTNELV